MHAPSPLFKALAAALAAAALGAWLLAPEARRAPSALLSWQAWKLAKAGDIDAARDALEKADAALPASGEARARWSWPTGDEGGRKKDAQKTAWDAATLEAFSGSWTEAALGFARAAGSGSSLPKDAAFLQLGNALYRLGETGEAGPDPRGAWKAAVAAYEKSLEEKYSQDAWDNREFVAGKLRQENQKRQGQKQQGQGDPQEGQGGQGASASPEDERSLERQMDDATRRDRELRPYLRPDGKRPQNVPTPSELLRDVMGGGAEGGERKDW